MCNLCRKQFDKFYSYKYHRFHCVVRYGSTGPLLDLKCIFLKKDGSVHPNR